MLNLLQVSLRCYLDRHGRGGGYEYVELFFLLFSNIFLDHVCVPLFFFLSGFLFFLKSPESLNKDWFISKYKSRLKSLLIPYIIANTLFIIGGILLLLKNNQGNEILFENIISGYWADSNGLPADPPLWFLRDLMLSVLLSPLFYIAVKKLSWFAPAILGIIWLTDSFTAVNIWRPQAYFFFCFGACFAMKNKDFVNLIKQGYFFFINLAIYIFMLRLYFQLDESCYLKLSIVLAFPMVIYLAKIISAKTKHHVSKEKVTSTFFIYLYHYYIASLCWRFYCYMFGITQYSLIISYFMGALTSILICYATYYFLDRFFPKTLSVMVGGRG